MDSLKVDPGELAPHPLNPNVMAGEFFEKLVANMRRMGRCPAVLCRRLPDGTLQIIDGHHRVKAAKRLRWPSVEVEVWEKVSEEDAAFLLTTLNRLRGRDNRQKRAELVKGLRQKYDADELAAYLPETAEQIAKFEEYVAPVVDENRDEKLAAETSPFSVLLEPKWERTINAAIKLKRSQGGLPETPSHETHGGIAEDLRRGAALFEICADFVLRNTPSA
jgi:ParB-like chromosome segregation protein Spo0J